MLRKSNTQFTLPAAVLALALSVAPAMAQSPAPEPAPDQAVQQQTTMVRGELLRVDAEEQQFWIKDADGRELEFRYTAETEVIGEAQNVEGLAEAEDVEGLATKAGTHLTVEFRAEGAEAVATKIAIHAQEQEQVQPSPERSPAPQQ